MNMRTFRAVLVGVAIALAVFLLTLRFGIPVSIALDASWAEVLGWSHVTHKLFGTQIVYNYGPLGFLYPNSPLVPEIFWDFEVGQILLAAGFAFVCGRLLHDRPLLALLFVCLLCLWHGLIAGEMTWPFTLLFGTTLLINDLAEDRKNFWWLDLVVVAALADAIALAKFSSMLPLWFVALIVIAGSGVAKRLYLRSMQSVATFVGGLVVFWIYAGQSSANMGEFLRTSWEIMAGYGQSMGTPAPIAIQAIGAMLLLYLGALLIGTLWLHRRKPAGALPVLLSGGALFLAWRAFFTRGDHAPLFFVFVSFLPLLLPLTRDVVLPALARRALLAVSAGALLGGYSLLLAASHGMVTFPVSYFATPAQVKERMASTIRDLTHLDEVKARHDSEWLNVSRSVDLPNIRRVVQNKRVDMVMNEQGVVLLNGFNYAPRPVYQSHAAFTPYLDRLNEAYFLGPEAPEYVLLKIAPIDNHFPSQDDSLAITALLRAYHSVLIESGYLLLEHDSGKSNGAITPLDGAALSTVVLGTETPVPDAGANASIAHLRLDLTFWGKLYSFVLREPLLKMVVRTSDDREIEYRFVRPTAGAGFILSPLLRTNRDWINFLLGGITTKVRSFRIEPVDAWQRRMFADRFQFHIGALPGELHHPRFAGVEPARFQVVKKEAGSHGSYQFSTDSMF